MTDDDNWKERLAEMQARIAKEMEAKRAAGWVPKTNPLLERLKAKYEQQKLDPLDFGIGH